MRMSPGGSSSFWDLVIGTLAGFFGVGGGFLLTPMLNALFGIPYGVARRFPSLSQNGRG